MPDSSLFTHCYNDTASRSTSLRVSYWYVNDWDRSQEHDFREYSLMSRVVYSHHYNIGFFGLERLHPFDSRKYGRAWRQLRRHFGRSLDQMWMRPSRGVNRAELTRVHSPHYLKQLHSSAYVARALELPPVRHLPGWLVDRHILRPMRWATMGTILAARQCLQRGLAVNLGGGYHHAKPESGEGFSIYADVAIAVAALRKEGLLNQHSRVAYVDVDAHQGNGVCHAVAGDNRVFILDIYNNMIFPSYDVVARNRIDCDIGISCACHDSEYLRALRDRLPGFLDSITRSTPVAIAFYNAGTDVFADDPLGGLSISASAILQRDLFVVGELRQRGIPTVMVLSGGYTKQSYQLVADSVIALLEREMDMDANAATDSRPDAKIRCSPRDFTTIFTTRDSQLRAGGSAT